jgi:hypothetical protein
MTQTSFADQLDKSYSPDVVRRPLQEEYNHRYTMQPKGLKSSPLRQSAYSNIGPYSNSQSKTLFKKVDNFVKQS